MFTILKMLRRAKGQPDQGAVAMLGIKPGDRVLLLGASRPGLAGAIGHVTGLNGQTTVVDQAPGSDVRIAKGAAGRARVETEGRVWAVSLRRAS